MADETQFNVRADSDLVDRISTHCKALEVSRGKFFDRAATRELVFPSQLRFHEVSQVLMRQFGDGAGIVLNGDGLSISSDDNERWRPDEDEPGMWVNVTSPGSGRWRSDWPHGSTKGFRLDARASTTPNRERPTSEFVHADLVLLDEQAPHGGLHVARIATHQVPVGTGLVAMGNVRTIRDYAVLADENGTVIGG